MRRIVDRVAIAGLVALACSCAPGLQVETDYDPRGEFNNFREWSFVDTPRARGGTMGGLDATMRAQIENAISKELKSRKFRSADAGAADFLVAYHGDTQDRITIDTYGYFPGRWTTSNAGDPYLTGGSTRPYIEGALVLDIVDAKSKELVWRARATDVVTDRADAGEKAAKAVKRMLEDFPPRR